MRFDIKAFHPTEGVVVRQVDADSGAEATRLVETEGIEVLSIRKHHQFSIALVRPSPFDVLQFSQELELLLAAGLSLVEALDALTRKTRKPAQRDILGSLLLAIRAGKSFSAAASARPDLFPPIFIALISAGEQTGGLSDALQRFIAYREQIDSVRKRLTAAVIYPALLIGVGSLVIAFLMFYVVPRFTQIYEDFGRDLPWMSKLLIEWGGIVHGHGGKLATGALLLIAGGYLLIQKTNVARHLWQRFAAGTTLQISVQELVLARFYRTLGMLLQGGISIVNALQLSRVLIPQNEQDSVSAAISEIRAGISLSAAMENNGLAPAIASDLLRVGERSGDMGQKMTRIANFLDEQTSRRIELFVKLFEPFLMMTIGLFIALIVVLLYLPIFELAGSLQ